MSVHPIEFRYYSAAMRALFTEEAKLQNWLTVEAALARAHAALGHIPKAASVVIGLVESSLAKYRLFRIPSMFTVVLFFSFLTIILEVFG